MIGRVGEREKRSPDKARQPRQIGWRALSELSKLEGATKFDSLDKEFWRGLSHFLMNKQEAAEFLGISTRTLERHTKASRVAARYEKGKTSDVLVYDREELERFKAELESPVHLPTIEADAPINHMVPQTATSSDTALARFGEGNPMGDGASDFAFALVQAIAQMQPHADAGPVATPPSQKLLLSLGEAQSYSGLSRANLMDAIHGETLAAQKIGRGWKIKRRDLENYVEAL